MALLDSFDLLHIPSGTFLREEEIGIDEMRTSPSREFYPRVTLVRPA